MGDGPRFRFVHGAGGASEDALERATVGREERNADAGGRVDRAVGSIDRPHQRVEDSRGDGSDDRFSCVAAEDDDGLVPAEPGNVILAPCALVQAPCALLEVDVARIVAEGVVHFLEPVEVHDQECHGAAARARPLDGLLRVRLQLRIVGS